MTRDPDAHFNDPEWRNLAAPPPSAAREGLDGVLWAHRWADMAYGEQCSCGQYFSGDSGQRWQIHAAAAVRAFLAASGEPEKRHEDDLLIEHTMTTEPR